LYLLLLGAAAVLLLEQAAAVHHAGDFIHASRRGQFLKVGAQLGMAVCLLAGATHQQYLALTACACVPAVLQHRTQWHDLIEHHCPRFGQTRLVSCWPPTVPQQANSKYRLPKTCA
jgi:hypothetical protein